MNIAVDAHHRCDEQTRQDMFHFVVHNQSLLMSPPAIRMKLTMLAILLPVS